MKIKDLIEQLKTFDPEIQADVDISSRGVESRPGELVRRTQQNKQERSWKKRGLFKMHEKPVLNNETNRSGSGFARNKFSATKPQLEEKSEVSCAAVESGPGELRRRTQRSTEPNCMRRGLFKAGFNRGAPRLRAAKKFTK